MAKELNFSLVSLNKMKIQTEKVIFPFQDRLRSIPYIQRIAENKIMAVSQDAQEHYTASLSTRLDKHNS